MRQCLLLALLICLAQTRNRRTKAVIDGVEYEVNRDVANALGKWGVNLVDLDSDQVVQDVEPDDVEIQPKIVKEDRDLANSPVGYLARYGFMEVALNKTEEELMSDDTFIGFDAIRQALRRFQRFYGLRATGKADKKTLKFMRKSRCGAKDESYEKPNRAKRYTLSRKRWPVHTLKYWFDPAKYTADLSIPEIRSEFERALKMWADQADVSFVEVADVKDAHVKISWNYGDHGDGYPFYGPGGTLAHAFYPTKGMLHFDDAEDYTIGTVLGTNLHYVATHEMGHILGLKHADNSKEDAIMYALYTGYTDNLQLHEDDIEGVVAAMGAGSGTVTPLGGDSGDGGDDGPTPTPGADDVPECIVQIDAAVHWDHDPEYVYIFAGDWYYRLKPKNPDGGNFLPIVDPASQPKRIGIDGFPGVPRKIEAAVETLEDVNKFYVFKGDKYFIYDFVRGRVQEQGTLSDLWPNNTPEKIEGAFKINQNTLGFISGDKLYTYARSGKKWLVGAAGSNYFDKYDDLNSISLAFYRSWAWVFRGNYYSVARSKNGKESSNYILRSIKPDLKLPMCAESVDGMTKGEKKKCKKELKKFTKAGGNWDGISSECKDYVADKYRGAAEFDRNDFV